MVLSSERFEEVVLLTLRRPSCLNALNVTLTKELVDHLSALEVDETVKALVITGEGEGFCSGGDIREFASTSALIFEAKTINADEALKLGLINEIVEAFFEKRKPKFKGK